MPVIKLYPNGLTGGVPPRSKNTKPPPRGECHGWTFRTSRGNTRFLYSVLPDQLPTASSNEPLLGLSGSLTVGECPSTHSNWVHHRQTLFKRLRRMGLHRLHWLTEWQKRGVPHLHFAAWFNIPDSDYDRRALPAIIKADWLYLTCRLRSSDKAQHVEPITNELGWLQYLSKHASRGAAHYQRADASIPSGWVKTGRMWGHLGEWPTREPDDINFDNFNVWWDFRRIIRSWRIAQARTAPKNRGPRIKSARKMLQCSDRKKSAVRGVSEWIDSHLGNDIYRFSHQLDRPSTSFLDWSSTRSGICR